LAHIFNNMADLYKKQKQVDSSIHYAKLGLKEAGLIDFKQQTLVAYNLLAELYETTDPKEAVRYYKMAADAKDSLYGTGNIQAIETIANQEEEHKKEIEAANIANQNKLKQYALLAGLGIFLIAALILFRNNKQKQQANKVLESTLSNLKSTQAQLIQSEKMASLGELTAGIAHEIQNPLNFVNNFSELNIEMLLEMKQEIDKGNYPEVKSIADNLTENEHKISHHGKRADSIVKGMLQHSKTSTGQKELTNINALADEYLRLSYHGLRAKDKDFNADMKTDFDKTVGNINIVPQDIGRVLLNLYNNAFYSVNEKRKAHMDGYKPTVSVITKKIDERVELRVKDNGTGIPQREVDKIFQPFFTTKPTGQGTGLGLSLSYDIIRAHGGEIKVETKEGESAEFIISLPVI
ncbi:MAG TPA: ATP-binding protein, partial [Puia sp.]|nr:ATP-binding protein [Puia sp.]